MGDDVPLRNCIRERRAAKNLTVERLAQEIGITRQSLWMIESSKVSPNATVALRLARVLDTTVERLFWEEDDLLTAHFVGSSEWDLQEPNRAYLAKIEGRAVARIMSDKNGYGRLVSSAQGVVRSLLKDSQQVQVEVLGNLERLDNTVFISGCDLGLGLFSAYTRHKYRQGEGIWFNVTNQAALQELARGETHVAAIHLNAQDNNWNVPDWVLRDCHQYLFASEQIGWILPRGNPKGFREPSDLHSGTFKLVNRPPGAGARAVLDQVLRVANVNTEVIPGYYTYANGHYEVAEMVSRGLADVGVGHASAAALLGLDFISIHEEQCWLVVPKAYEQLNPVQAALEVLHSDTFRVELQSMAPYDVQDMGHTRRRS